MDHLLSPDGILPTLRAETAVAHQQLEDAVAIPRRLVDLTQYRQLLGTFLGFYRPLEKGISAVANWLDAAEERKTTWLEADLGALGLTASQIIALPDCSELPDVGTSARAMGCRYVLEGATLGGRHISAMMDRGGAVPLEARRFFSGYGEKTGEHWRQFVAALERHAAGVRVAERGEIIQGASETFACLHHWYVRQYHPNALPG